jgi:8-oxo-dGTP diphosphatase
MKKYCLGFAFDAARKRVVLIRKKRPSWQAGQLNGVGGHVEEGETFWQCMVREYREETGVDTFESDWTRFGRLHSGDFEMEVFANYVTNIEQVKTMTDEPVGIYSVALDVSGISKQYKLISNLSWLIPVALDKHFIESGYLLEARYER